MLVETTPVTIEKTTATNTSNKEDPLLSWDPELVALYNKVSFASRHYRNNQPRPIAELRGTLPIDNKEPIVWWMDTCPSYRFEDPNGELHFERYRLSIISPSGMEFELSKIQTAIYQRCVDTHSIAVQEPQSMQQVA